MRADNVKECAEDIIRKKLKVRVPFITSPACTARSLQVAGGADYDTGSNATGYKSSGNIKAKALEAYSQKARKCGIHFQSC